MGAFMRNFATPLSFITFLGVGITGILMLFDIRGPLGDLHEWLGIGFVGALLLHLVRNWRGLFIMLKTRTSKQVIAVAGALIAVLIVTHLPVEPQQGHGGAGMLMNRVAAAPIAMSAPALGLSGEQAVARLRERGVEVDGAHETLAQIARDHDQPLPKLFALLINDR